MCSELAGPGGRRCPALRCPPPPLPLAGAARLQLHACGCLPLLLPAVAACGSIHPHAAGLLRQATARPHAAAKRRSPAGPAATPPRLGVTSTHAAHAPNQRQLAFAELEQQAVQATFTAVWLLY